jgi:glycosyltransferase involved in cell wall biosynthesis
MITTILPTFQRPQLLKRAIQSVLSQTFSDFILHIHDNASQDETEKVVSQFQDPRIKYFKRETNIGLVQNFAHAIDQVTTPYFSFLSDDDFLLPKFYVTTLEGFEKYPTAGFSAGRTLKCSSKGKYPKDQYIHPFLDGYFLAGDALIALAETKNFPIWTGILFKTELVKQLGGACHASRPCDRYGTYFKSG